MPWRSRISAVMSAMALSAWVGSFSWMIIEVR